MKLGLEHTSTNYQLVLKREKTDKVNLHVIKTIDDISSFGPDSELQSFFELFDEKLNFYTVCHVLL